MPNYHFTNFPTWLNTELQHQKGKTTSDWNNLFTFLRDLASKEKWEYYLENFFHPKKCPLMRKPLEND